MIRGIIFDCFGVLYHGSLDHLRELTPPERLTELKDLSRSYDRGYLSQAEYFDGVGELIGKDPSEIELICRKEHVRNEMLVTYIKDLKKTYKIGLLSNVGRGFIEQLFSPEDLEQLFDAEVLSNEVGILKPDPAIFRLAAEKLELAPEECAMIDDIVRNTAGAEAVGMKGIVYQSLSQMDNELREILGKSNA